MYNHNHNTCFGGPGRTNCQNEIVEGLFCADCRAAMRTPKQDGRRAPAVDMSICPCGKPAEEDGLCGPHFSQARKVAFR